MFQFILARDLAPALLGSLLLLAACTGPARNDADSAPVDTAPEDTLPAGDYDFADEQAIADAYFSIFMPSYSTVMETMASTKGRGFGCPVITESDDGYVATAGEGCTADDDIYHFRGTLEVDWSVQGQWYMQADEFAFDIEHDFLGLEIDGMMEITYGEDPTPNGVFEADDYTVRAFGPLFPWNDTAWPDPREFAATYSGFSDRIVARDAAAERYDETFEGSVQIEGAGSFGVSGSAYWDGTQPCLLYPNQGEVVLNGVQRLTVRWTDAGCEQYTADYALDDGREGVLSLSGNIPMYY